MSQTMANFQAANTDLIRHAADCLASAPHLTAVERQSLWSAAVHAIMAFLPTEPRQTMFASEAVGLHLSVMDLFRDIGTRALTVNESARLRMVAVAEIRTALQVARELRVIRKDAMAAFEADEAVKSSAGEAPEPAEIPLRRATPPIATPPAGAPRAAATESADDATFHTHLAEFEAIYAQTMATLEEVRALDKSSAAQAGDQLAAAFPARLAAGAGSLEGSFEEPATGSRAFRRAMMKQRGRAKAR